MATDAEMPDMEGTSPLSSRSTHVWAHHDALLPHRYISSEFIDRHEDRRMLLIAHELCALVVLVDGVDEAAGMREIVEAFVHYELVPSGNRLMVTSRPEGVDVDEYKSRFVIVRLPLIACL